MAPSGSGHVNAAHRLGEHYVTGKPKLYFCQIGDLIGFRLSYVWRGSADANLLGLWVRIPPRAWMSVSCMLCVVR
jgi:hypothetical protein